MDDGLEGVIPDKQLVTNNAVTNLGNGVFTWKVVVNYGTGRKVLYVAAENAFQAIVGVCETAKSVRPEHIHSVKMLGCTVAVVVAHKG